MRSQKLGKKIYYLKSTGEVVYDTGERHGFFIPSTLEEDIKAGGLQRYDKDDLKVKEIPFGHLKEKFTKYPYYKINPDGTFRFFGIGEYQHSIMGII